MTNITLANYDTLTGMFMRPLVESLIATGHHININADGNDIAAWENWARGGTGPAFGKDGTFSLFNGVLDDQTIRNSGWAVVGTATTPEHEATLLQRAWKFEIPTGIIVDVPASHRRLGLDLSQVNVFFVADEATRKVVADDYPDTKTVIVGSPAVKKLVRNPAIIGELNGQRMVQWVGSSNLDELRLVVDIMRSFLTDYAIFYSLHPTKGPDPAEVEQIVAPIKGRVITNLTGGFEAALMEADYVFNGLSTVGNMAAYNGRYVVTIKTGVAIEAAGVAHPGLNQFPLELIGVSPVIKTTEDPRRLEFRPAPGGSLTPYDPQLVVNALMS